MKRSKILLKDLYGRRGVFAIPDTVDSQLRVLYCAYPLVHDGVYLNNEDLDYVIDFLDKIEDRLDGF